MELKCIFVLILLSLNLTDSKKKPKSVTTVLDAKWDVTPLVLEMAEFLSDESSSFYWKFVDSISSLDPPLIYEKTDKAGYDRALSLLEPLLSEAQISLMKFALSLHVYSPRVEMFCQIALENEIDCPTAVEMGDQLYCDIDSLQKAFTAGAYKNTNVTSELIRLDHKYPKGDSGPLLILYGELGTPEFAQFHKYLSSKASQNEVQYVARHWVKERQPKRLRLSGYGVELQLKSTEYKAQDDTKVEGGNSEESEEDEEEEVEGFNFNKLKSLYPDKIQELEKLRQELLESSSELAPLKVWQFQELSLQAAQRIMSAPKEEALHTLSFISQNFPSQARSLVKTAVSPDFKTEMRKNQDRFTSALHLQPSDTALFINGMFFDLETQDIFAILEHVREELRVMEGLNDIVNLVFKGVSEKKVFRSLLTLDLSSSGLDFGLDIRDSAVLWINDIEKDKAYARWSSSLLDLLRPTFLGMVRSVKKNLYNLVLIGNPAESKVIPLVKLMQSFLIHNAPLRLGIVFALDESKNGLEDAGVALLNAYNYIAEIKDNSQALNFLTDVYAAVKEDIRPEDVHELLTTAFPGHKKDDVFGPDSDYNTGLKLSSEFVQKSGLRNMPQVLLNGVPLPEKSLTSDDFEEAVMNEIMNQNPILQKAIYKGDLSDGDNVVDFLMERPNIMPRLNERILTTSKSKYLSLTKFTDQSILNLINDHLFYASAKKGGKKGVHFISNWLVGDLNTPEGRQLLLNSLEQIESNSNVRSCLIVNQKAPSEINKVALALLMENPDVGKLREIIHDHDQISSGSKTYSNYGIKNIPANLEDVMKYHSKFVRNVLNFNPGEHGVVSNGRIIGPFEKDESFTQDDFGLLERFSSSSYVDKIYNAFVKNSEDLDALTSDVLMKTVSLLASRPESKSRFEINSFGEEHSVVKLPSSSEGSAFSLVAVVDPVSSGAHKVGTILSVLQQVINCDIKIFFNCVEKNSDMPLKSYYRYVLEPTIQFTSSGQMSSGPMAKFSNMPGTPLLTQNMLVPDNWMVESVATPFDLDNIKLDQVSSNVHSNFELEYLILEGHCFDSMLGTPPRGLQITLGTDRNPTDFDTIVMANLGYFQLKANPGEWTLRLRYGRSAALYDIIGYGHAGVEFPVNSSEIKILLSSFRSHTIKLKVTKKPDKANVDLLGEDEEQQGLWGSITSTFGAGDNAENKDEVINIFSVASGHLYERFLKIMMLSVLKHTNTPVKFWFLKNYLSPTLKDSLPRMARQYGFAYELVQYKWPRWLHQQTEKQRIIWGYKILFLDVLFPLDVKKIIFVDADQVVRADMKELVDLDLGGAPYGYTPFCESRTEMDGFRFWKSGYWRNHLQGRKYHISALYVVDLKRFRRIAAGDRLRGQYQALSQDPNSLSNLDQDLPNNMIHQVAIKSLPQEWLWCETWCDDESKKSAKTIDLCNNPMTKEAKLTAAMRIVAEWKDYDKEVKEVLLRMGETEGHEEENVDQAPKAVPVPDVHSEL